MISLAYSQSNLRKIIRAKGVCKPALATLSAITTFYVFRGNFIPHLIVKLLILDS